MCACLSAANKRHRCIDACQLGSALQSAECSCWAARWRFYCCCLRTLHATMHLCQVQQKLHAALIATVNRQLAGGGWCPGTGAGDRRQQHSLPGYTCHTALLPATASVPLHLPAGGSQSIILMATDCQLQLQLSSSNISTDNHKNCGSRFNCNLLSTAATDSAASTVNQQLIQLRCSFAHLKSHE